MVSITLPLRMGFSGSGCCRSPTQIYDCREVIPSMNSSGAITVLSDPMDPFSQIEGRFPRTFFLICLPFCFSLGMVSDRSLFQRVEQQTP